MPVFAPNLTFLWTELPVLERFAAAARAGFSQVEIHFVHDLDLDQLNAVLREHKLTLHHIGTRAGDFPKGDRGVLSMPGREQEFLANIRETLAHAKRLGARKINVLAGIPPAGVSREQAFATALQNLKVAAPLFEEAGNLLLLENINTFDMPGYFLDTPDRAAELALASGSQKVRLQLDQYHAGMMSLDARVELKKHYKLIEHIQIADVPGRHQPGTGTQPIGEFLAELDALNFRGPVGLEYKPQGSTEESLGWLDQETTYRLDSRKRSELT